MYVRDIAKFRLFEFNRERAQQQPDARPDPAPAASADVLDISAAGRRLAGSTSRNRQIDASVDVQAYIDQIKEHNREALADAGQSVKARNADVWQHSYHAFKAALTEKYGKLADEARTHADPEDYVLQKYHNRHCSWYAADLTDEERQIGYVYERDMLTRGKIMGVKYRDSLFRGLEVDGGIQDRARDDFDQAMVAAQIGNILKADGITLAAGEDCRLSVDPYAENISVSGPDAATAARMEAALNVGDNGRQLFFRLNQHYTRDWQPDHGQITAAGADKYQAYRQVYDLTGLKLNELAARDGTFRTEDGTDVRELVNAAVDGSARIPATHKQQMKDWVARLVGDLAAEGWEGVADLTLSVGYNRDGLTDR